MSELQTFTVDSEALSLLASVTSRESATDPEELPSAESSAAGRRSLSRAVSNNRPPQFIWIVRTCPVPMCELHTWALFCTWALFYPDN
eukprot:scaffold53004_cov56-Attheya_sp.AAC.1